MAHPQTTTVTVTAAAAATAGQRRSCCGGCMWWRLMKKLKKHSHRMLCMATRPAAAAFDCHYDPLSYARNFDHDGNGGGSSHFPYALSSRFVAAAKPALVQSNSTVTR